MTNVVFLKHSHKIVGVGRCGFSCHNTSFDFYIVFTVKDKIV